MTNIESGQSPTAEAVCYHGYPVVHRISRRSHSYGRSFSSCPIYWQDPESCRFFSWDDEPRAQVSVKQYQTTAEYMCAPQTASLSSRQVKCPSTSSTEDLLQVPPNSRERACTGPDSPSLEYEHRSPSPLEGSATAQSELMPARPVMSEEVIQDMLDALPAIPIYVRELKRQISTLQESNEMMESRILQLEKQLWKEEEWRGFD